MSGCGPSDRSDAARCGRGAAALRGRLLHLPPAAQRSVRTGETDAAGRAVQELHDGGEEGGGRGETG